MAKNYYFFISRAQYLTNDSVGQAKNVGKYIGFIVTFPQSLPVCIFPGGWPTLFTFDILLL